MRRDQSTLAGRESAFASRKDGRVTIRAISLILRENQLVCFLLPAPP